VAGAAGNFATLVAGRAAQGVFGALLAPAALSIVAVTFDNSRHRARAFGIFGAIAGAGGAVGLLAGGLLIQHLNWRWTLYVNVILAAIGVAGAAGFLRQGARSAQRPALEWWGTALVSAGLFAVVYGLSRANSAGWASASSWGFLVAAVVLLVFGAWYAFHGVGPFRAEVLRQTAEPGSGALTVELRVSNDGDRKGRTRCRITGVGPDGRLRSSEVKLSPVVPGHGSVQFQLRGERFADAHDVQTSCA